MQISATTEEDIPEFDRKKVSLDIPPQAIGGGFTIVTSISKIISKIILVSIHCEYASNIKFTNVITYIFVK